MNAGDIVVYLADVAGYGLGLVKRVLSDGKLRVEFERTDEAIARGQDEYFTEDFHPQELEVATVWAKTNDAEVFTDATLQRLAGGAAA